MFGGTYADGCSGLDRELPELKQLFDSAAEVYGKAESLTTVRGDVDDDEDQWEDVEVGENTEGT